MGEHKARMCNASNFLYFVTVLSQQQRTGHTGARLSRKGYFVNMRDYGGERNRPSESGRDAEGMVLAHMLQDTMKFMWQK